MSDHINERPRDSKAIRDITGDVSKPRTVVKTKTVRKLVDKGIERLTGQSKL